MCRCAKISITTPPSQSWAWARCWFPHTSHCPHLLRALHTNKRRCFHFQLQPLLFYHTLRRWCWPIHFRICATKNLCPPPHIIFSWKDNALFSLYHVVDLGIIAVIQKLFFSANEVIPNAACALAGP